LPVSWRNWSWAPASAHLFGQRGIGIDARLFQAADLLLELFQRGLDRRHQLADGLLALVEVAASPARRLLGFQRGAGEFEEALVVLRQRIGRNRLEGVGEAVARGRFQRGLALGEQGALAFQLALQRGAAYRQRRLLALRSAGQPRR
jgi:hypothetical protein